MRIFLAGATGVIGARLLPRMLAAGHHVAAMTRSAGKLGGLELLGATPVLCDVFDAAELTGSVLEFRPDVLVHLVTDLHDDVGQLDAFLPASRRALSEGTRNLLAAACVADTRWFVAQSIAWRRGANITAHECAVRGFGGVVLRYGQLYGPGTSYVDDLPPAPRIHVDVAAERTMAHLTGPAATVTIVDEALTRGPQDNEVCAV